MSASFESMVAVGSGMQFHVCRTVFRKLIHAKAMKTVVVLIHLLNASLWFSILLCPRYGGHYIRLSMLPVLNICCSLLKLSRKMEYHFLFDFRVQKHRYCRYSVAKQAIMLPLNNQPSQMQADIKEKSVIFRPAKPDFSEGLQFAYYMDQAAEGFFHFMLGSESERIIATAFIDSSHAFSHENVVFAEVDRMIVGMSSTFTEEQQREFTDEPLLRAAGRNAIRLRLMRILFAPVWRILENIPEGDFYLLGIAIEPGLRGTGIGSLLMNDIENRAKASASYRLSLDVSAKNDGARRLYKRLGMVESSKWPDSRFLSPLFIRMSKYL